MVNHLLSSSSYFFLLFLLHLLQTNDGEQFKICKLHRGGKVRAVYTHHGQLRIIFEDNLWSLPLEDGHVDAATGRLHMFGDFLQNLGAWHLHPHYAAFQDRMANQGEQLEPIQVAYLKGISPEDSLGYLLAVMGVDGQVMQHYLARLGPAKPTLVHLGYAVQKYVVLGPSEKPNQASTELHGIVLRMGGTWLLKDSILVDCQLRVLNSSSKTARSKEWSARLPPVPFKSSAAPKGQSFAVQSGASYYWAQVKASGLLLKATSNESLVPHETAMEKRPIKSSKIFGFLYQDTVHLWDMKSKLVTVVRQVMPVRADHLYPLKYVPMDAYFACNFSEWEREEVTVRPGEDVIGTDAEDSGGGGGVAAFLLKPHVMGSIVAVLVAFVLLSCVSWVLIRGSGRSTKEGAGGGGGRRATWFSPVRMAFRAPSPATTTSVSESGRTASPGYGGRSLMMGPPPPPPLRRSPHRRSPYRR